MTRSVCMLLVGFFVLTGTGNLNSIDQVSTNDDAQKYMIRIESGESGQEVKFVASYVFGSDDMEVVHEETPHILMSNSPRLNVIIQGESADSQLEAYFYEYISDEDSAFRMSGSGRTIVFGTQWTRRSDNELEENHYVTVR